MKNKLSPLTTTLGLGTLLCTLAFTQRAHSAVVVYFEQQATGVRISWTGTLNIKTGTVNSYGAGGGSTIISSTIQYSGASKTTGYYSMAGSATPTSIPTQIPPQPADAVGPWGFNNANIYWSADMVSAGTVGIPTQLKFDPTKQYVFHQHATLLSYSSTPFNNTLAWTAGTTGDTIRYMAGPAPIPEASTTLLTAVTGASLLVRRRRRQHGE